MLRELAETILKGLGYTVITAKDGNEAIQIFTTNNDKIQLAVLDVIMPVCSGKEAYERMRAVKPALKVIFVTGYSIATHHTESIAKRNSPFSRSHSAKRALQKGERGAGQLTMRNGDTENRRMNILYPYFNNCAKHKQKSPALCGAGLS